MTFLTGGRSGCSVCRRSFGGTVSIFYRSEHWHIRAEEMRRIAESLSVIPHAKASMLRIAEEYERLATRAERLKSE
jgi:hypothetical protein